jgi:hypothetical protein
MNFLIWNERGLNHPSKQQEVRSMIKIHKIGLICLIETRVKLHNANKIRSCIVLIRVMNITMINIFWGGFGFVGRRQILM